MIFCNLSECVYCVIKCICLFKLLSKVNCFFGNVIVRGISGKSGFVFILIIFDLGKWGIMVNEFRICFIIICLGYFIEVRLYVLFYLFINSIYLMSCVCWWLLIFNVRVLIFEVNILCNFCFKFIKLVFIVDGKLW